MPPLPKMTKRYIIDACNLMFASRKLEETLEQHGFQAARAMLVGMLERFLRAEHLSSRDFLRRVTRVRQHAADPLRGEDPRKFATGMTTNELDFWMKYFGIEE